MKRKNVFIAVISLTISRLFINITRRFTYPFVPTISQQLGVSVSSIQSVIAMQSGIGVISPLFGTLSESFGRKRVIMGVLLMMAVAGMIGTIRPDFWIYAGVMIIFGVGKMIYDPAMQAYLGEHIPYHQRAQAVGITELSWAGSLMIAAPAVGFILDLATIQIVFVLITILMIIALLVIQFFLPSDALHKSRTDRVLNPLAAWHILRQSPAALASLSFTLLLATANEMFLINYGLWMELSFDLVLTTLGIATIAISVGEVLGEFTVIGFADRFGKRRLALWCSILSGSIYIIFPFLSFSLPIALIGLFLIFFFFEIAIVASIALFTEILPDARAVMMSGVVGGHSLGRLLGAFLGGLLYATTGDFQLMGTIATLIGIAATAMMWRFIHETPLVTPDEGQTAF